jgi:hypothetical protein
MIVRSSQALSLIFVGHMVDAPDRPTPRFPPWHEPLARIAIEHRVASHAKDRSAESIRAFAGLSAGGDILFHEVCRATFGIDTAIVLPFSPDRILQTSVEYADAGWSDRFWRLWQTTPQAHRYDLGLSNSAFAYAIWNRKIVALAQSEGNLQLIALWDGRDGGGPGGIVDLINYVEQNAGQVDIIDTKQLF